MKRLIPCLMLVSMCVSATFGAFDYTISDSFYYGTFTRTGDDSLLVTGAGATAIYAQNYSYIEVQNTAPLQENFGGIYTIDLNNYSDLNFLDGAIGALNLYGDATATLSGGSVGYISSYQDATSTRIENGHITFICDVDSVNLTGNLLTGDWLVGKGSFSITLQNQSGYDSVYSNIQFIPEPATLSLLGLGGLLIRRKLKQQHLLPVEM